jgi:hypothetical protein
MKGRKAREKMERVRGPERSNARECRKGKIGMGKDGKEASEDERKRRARGNVVE